MQKSIERRTHSDMLPVIIALAWPSMREHFMQTAVQYIDTAMVGTLGTQATAAVGSTTSLNWLINGSISALGVGFLSYIARSIGAKDEESARRASAQAVMVAFVVGVFFTILTLSISDLIPIWMQVDVSIREMTSQYFFILYTPMLFRSATAIFGTLLRAVGDTKTPMIIGVLVNLVNVVLNFLFIYPTREITVFSHSFTMYGAGLGVAGAAIASATAFTLGGILITIALWNHPVISPKGRSFKPDFPILKPCLRVALPNMLQRFGTSLGYVVFASMINSVGEVATAAHVIANTVESGFYIPGFGMQTAAATLAGNMIGAHDNKHMRELTSLVIKIEIMLMIISGGLLFIFAPQMVDIFSDSPEVIALGSTVLRMVAVSEPFFGVAIILEGIMHGVGNTLTPFVFSMFGMWGVRIVGTFIFVTILGNGLVAAWGCMIVHNLMLFAMYTVYYKSGRWNPLNCESESIV